MNDTFGAVIRGQILTSLTQAVVAGLIFWILGIPVPVIFATATFLGSLIPFIGTAGIWVPLVIYLVVVIPPVAVLVITITEQTIELYQLVVAYVREGHLSNLIDDIRSVGFVQRLEAQIVQWDVLKETASNWLLNSTKAIGNFAASQAGTINW